MKTVENEFTEVVFADDFADLCAVSDDFGGKKIAIFASENVPEGNVSEIKNALEKVGGSAFFIPQGDGESCKTVENAARLSIVLDELGFSRKDAIVNFGGGTICDLGGFVASVYKRGLTYYNVPTTLLCAVDACIGGKTAIDLGDKKNFWGTFHHPRKAIIVGSLMKNLPNDLVEAGKSEIVKYALLDKELKKYLTEKSDEDFSENILDIIEKCLIIKGRFVARDERDFGERRALNAGHTVAHAIEAASGYAVGHSTAVAIGLAEEMRIARSIGIVSDGEYEDFGLLCEKYLGQRKLMSQSELLLLVPFMKSDKKNSDGRICFVFPTDGGVKIEYFDESRLIETIKRL